MKPSVETSVPIGGHTQLVGLLGWPVEHSVSPPMQNAAFRALGLDWCYLPFAVPPEALADALRGARALGLRGLNATVPHKQALLSLVDELTPAAEAIQAVNTIAFTEKGILGHNTDAEGFLRALADEGFSPQGKRALALGAGGAARAVCCALLQSGAALTIANRTMARAASLAEDLAARLPQACVEVAPLESKTLAACAEADLVVNCTTLGMWPHVEYSPWPDNMPFPGHALAFDLIYNPRETRFLATARQSGARAANGLGMLVHQGAAAFALWTDIEPPTDVMRAACLQALEGE